jgi:predicted RNA binding protein YcfA (HicA-like mRNA interferase family)
LSRLANIPYRKVRRALLRLGFHEARQRGSHVWFEHEDGRGTTLSRHGDDPIGPGVMRKVLRDIHVDVDAFLELV